MKSFFFMFLLTFTAMASTALLINYIKLRGKTDQQGAEGGRCSSGSCCCSGGGVSHPQQTIKPLS